MLDNCTTRPAQQKSWILHWNLCAQLDKKSERCTTLDSTRHNMGPPRSNYGTEGGPSKGPREECNARARTQIAKREKKATKKSKRRAKRQVQPTLYSMNPKMPDAADLKAKKKIILLDALLDTAKNKARVHTPHVEDWTNVIWHTSARDFGRGLVYDVTRADLGESFSVIEYAKEIDKVEACAKKIAISLHHCLVDIQAGELKATFMKPAFDFFYPDAVLSASCLSPTVLPSNSGFVLLDRTIVWKLGFAWRKCWPLFAACGLIVWIFTMCVIPDRQHQPR